MFKTLLNGGARKFVCGCSGAKQFQLRKFSVLDSNNMIEQDLSKTYVGGFGDRALLVNNVLVRQSVILLPNNFVMWNVKRFEDITIESLSFLPLLYPTFDLLLIGCGEVLPGRLPLELVAHFRDRGIIVEASNTSNAASTFNILNSEGRNVAAALLTPLPWTGLDPNMDEE